MKIVLVRHGRPDEGHAERPHDPPLAEEGWRQARAAAALLAGEGITRIVTSPLLRARQTAEPLAARLGLKYYTFVSQVENGFGRVPIDGMEAWARALDIAPDAFARHLLACYEPELHRLLFGVET